MRTLVLASVRRHGRRYVATGVAIVMAVGFMVAVNALSNAARAGAADLAGRQLQGVDVVSDNPVDADRVFAAFQNDPDVVDSEVLKAGYVAVSAPRGPKALSVDTIDSDPSRVWQDVAAGRLPTSDREVVVDAGRMHELGLTIGSTVRVGDGMTGQTLEVVGTVEATGGVRSGALYVTPGFADRLGDQMYPSLVVGSVRDGAVPAEVAHRLNAVVEKDSDGDSVTSATALAESWRLSATDGVDVFQQLLLGFAVVALFVGALVIANTFAIVLAQRERDMALLRCIGASRRQVVRSVTTEAFVVGVVSALMGVVVGWLSAVALVSAAGRWLPTVAMADPSLSVAGAAIPVAVAVLVTVVAARGPARRVAAIPPVSALQPRQGVELVSRAGVGRVVVGVILLAVGGVALVVGAAGMVLAGLVGGLVSFLGVLMLLPLATPLVLRIAGLALRRSGVAARLAIANTGRNPRRTSSTLSALLVGITLVGTVLVGIATARVATEHELDVTKPLDVSVTADRPISGAVLDELRSIDGVADVVSLSGGVARIGESTVPVLSVDRAAAGVARGEALTPHDGEVLLPDGPLMASITDGQRVRVSVDDQPRELTAHFVSGAGDAALVSPRTGSALSIDGAGRAVWLRAAEGANPGSVLDAVVSAVGDGATVDGGLPERAEAMKQLDLLLGVVLSLLCVAVVIAVVGVGNTLGLSVLERSRENAMLRALGLSARGLRVTLAIESVVVASTAAVIGGALGVLYGWLGVSSLGAEVFETTPPLVVPWQQLGLLLVAAVVAGLLASVLPARRAARIKPAAGLAAA